MYFLFGFFVTLAVASAPIFKLFPEIWAAVVTIVIAIIAGTGLHVVANGNSFNLNPKERNQKRRHDLAAPSRQQANVVAVGLCFVLIAVFVFTALLSL